MLHLIFEGDFGGNFFENGGLNKRERACTGPSSQCSGALSDDDAGHPIGLLVVSRAGKLDFSIVRFYI